jgi:CO/xanthine dehydrogenase FAD-binding subunit
MMRYNYLRPASIKEACELLNQYQGEAKVIAGGTDLLVQVRDEDKKLADMKVVIDISSINDLRYITEEDGIIRLGTIVTHSQIYESPMLRSAAPMLPEACNTVGSPQIRHRGTIGGSVCNASPAADPVPALVALDAEVKIESVRGTRVVPMVEIFERPYKTNLAADELLTEISFKRLSQASKTAFIKLGRRKALAISRMNVAVVVELDEQGVVTDARIAPGSVLPTPGRVSEAEAILLGQKPTTELIEAASQKVAAAMIEKSGVRWSTPYKEPVIVALTRRALNQALGVE